MLALHFPKKKPLLESSFYEINMDYCEHKNAKYKAFSIANITGSLDPKLDFIFNNHAV